MQAGEAVEILSSLVVVKGHVGGDSTLMRKKKGAQGAFLLFQCH